MAHAGKYLGIADAWVFTSSDFLSNSYVCPIGSENDCVVIDPGLDGDSIEKGLLELDLVPRAVLCTHGHFDHIASAEPLQLKYGIPVYLRDADLPAAKSSNFLLAAFGLETRIVLPEFTLVTEDEYSVEIDRTLLKFFDCPGHTPGSVVIQSDHSIFSGDSFYRDGVGLSRLPGGDPEVLRTSILRIFEIMGDDHLVLPGHGRHGTLGAIRAENQRLQQLLSLTDGD